MLANKHDITQDAIIQNETSTDWIAISAKENTGIQTLKDLLLQKVLEDNNTTQDAIVITNQRHYEALQLSEQAIDNVLAGLQQQISSDFISQDLKTALRHLGSITGEVSMLTRISLLLSLKFCIGK
ncbi:MAG: hypothetical protein R2807_04105 [Chitinophagales bacterium]